MERRELRSRLRRRQPSRLSPPTLEAALEPPLKLPVKLPVLAKVDLSFPVDVRAFATSAVLSSTGVVAECAVAAACALACACKAAPIGARVRTAPRARAGEIPGPPSAPLAPGGGSSQLTSDQSGECFLTSHKLPRGDMPRADIDSTDHICDAVPPKTPEAGSAERSVSPLLLHSMRLGANGERTDREGERTRKPGIAYNSGDSAASAASSAQSASNSNAEASDTWTSGVVGAAGWDLALAHGFSVAAFKSTLPPSRACSNSSMLGCFMVAP
mmetsp:Transcript_35898/g.95131  ORF Transcript_35898/g.95131 Transcript_35898/m.95131 type:complete len:272 (+) Transcript_35898:155-970(+)